MKSLGSGFRPEQWTANCFLHSCLLILYIYAVLRIRIRMDLHLKRPPGSGSEWTEANPDPDPPGTVKKPRKCTGSLGEYRTGQSFVILKIIFCLAIFNDF